MNAKHYLQQIERLDAIVENKKLELEELRSIATSISVNTGSERVQTSGSKDKIGDIVAKIIDMQEELNQRTDEYIDTKFHIVQQLEGMDNITYYKLLYNRYVKRKKFEEIAVIMGYSWRQVMNIHVQALDAFEKKYLRK